MKKALFWIFVGFIFGTIGVLFIRNSLAQDKHEEAECTINSSEKPCAQGLVCIPFNAHSGNGKCEYPEVTVSPTIVPCFEQGVVITFNLDKEPSISGTPCPSISPVVTVEPTATPSASPKITTVPQGNNAPGDGLGCGNHDCNTHVNDAPPATSPYDGSPVGWK